jgi:hypothetical protein
MVGGRAAGGKPLLPEATPGNVLVYILMYMKINLSGVQGCTAGSGEHNSKPQDAWIMRSLSGRTDVSKHTRTIQRKSRRLSLRYLDDDESGLLEKNLARNHVGTLAHQTRMPLHVASAGC